MVHEVATREMLSEGHQSLVLYRSICYLADTDA